MSTPTRAPLSPWYAAADEARRTLILRSLPPFGGLCEALATHLGISKSTLYREAARLGITPETVSAVTKSVTAAPAR